MSDTTNRQLRDVCPIAERPTCAYCGQRMSPITSRTDWNYACGDKRMEVRPENAIRQVPSTGGNLAWTYWTGKYQRYGAFCKLACAERFAQAAFKAGFRMVKGEQ